ncbi:hypothetical protein A9Q84_19250 [Halobacteriovorax marinus]|uniref:Radical SAM core domain-containing protein n=1 Tax=Halobacteriovorax marinus TaxID=97084 RepID=A0A1Y5F7U6_9BACT|nr:hypothetical protein A9Q84_19250 [Halobacteriovorax marinus]
MKIATAIQYFKLALRMKVYRHPFTNFRIGLHFLLIRINILLKTKKLTISPPNIVFSLTSRCNKTCDFCHYITELNSPEHKEDELSYDSFVEILDSEGCPSVGRICLYGGEPLLNKDFFKILAEAKKRKFLTSIVTNGLLITKYKSELQESNLDLMTVSYYPEDVEKIKPSLVNISKYIPINLSYVVSNNRIDEIEKFLIYARDINAAMVTIENLRENGITSEESLKENEQLKSQRVHLTENYSKHFILRWSGFNKIDTVNLKTSCVDFWDTIFVNAKGQISPCCQYPLNSYFGDIKKKSSSVNSLEMLKLRDQISSNQAPKNCEGCHYLYAKDPLYKS